MHEIQGELCQQETEKESDAGKIEIKRSSTENITNNDRFINHFRKNPISTSA